MTWTPPRRLTEEVTQRFNRPAHKFWLLNVIEALLFVWSITQGNWIKRFVLLPFYLLTLAWTTPTTRATGNLITAAIWNIDVVDNLNYLKDKILKYAIINDTKAQNTAGGAFNSGAWRTRTLNTEVADPDGIVSLAADQMTLAAGTYLVRAFVPAYAVDSHQARLQNITDGTTLLVGSSEVHSSGSPGQTSSIIIGTFTLTGTKALEVQHQCQTTAPGGFGDPANFTTEIYTIVEIWKTA